MIIYLIRHSKPKDKIPFQKYYSLNKINLKKGLSSEGKLIAEKNLGNPIYKNVDYIYSSNYLRAKQTAEILSKKLNKNIIIDERIKERIHGEQIPENFEKRQFEDEYYKLKNGESQVEVRNRMLNFIEELLSKYDKETIAVFTHSTAITFLLKEWCDIEYNGSFKYKEKELLKGNLSYATTIKLEFENKKIKNIEYISNEQNKIEISILCEKKLKYYEEMLKNKNIPCEFKFEVKDIYYSNISINELKNMKENDIKNNCIRIRFTRWAGKEFNQFKIQNSERLLNIFKKKQFNNKNKLSKIEKILTSNGFKKVFESYKTDYQYLNGGLQLQDVEDIGMMVYYYDDKLYYLKPSEQVKLLSDKLEKLGFGKYNGKEIDRLRSKLIGKTCYRD